MRDVHGIYAENSSINLTKQMYKLGSLKQSLLSFIKEDFSGLLGDVKYRVYDEYDYTSEQTVCEGPEFYCEFKAADYCMTYIFTDYSFMTYIHHKGEYATRIKDDSEEWVQYLTQQLSGSEREEYITGLKIFVNKLSKSIENQFLSAITDEKQLEQ